MNSGLLALGQSSACADEMQKPVSSAVAQRRCRRPARAGFARRRCRCIPGRP